MVEGNCELYLYKYFGIIIICLWLLKQTDRLFSQYKYKTEIHIIVGSVCRWIRDKLLPLPLLLTILASVKNE